MNEPDLLGKPSLVQVRVYGYIVTCTLEENILYSFIILVEVYVNYLKKNSFHNNINVCV